MKGVVDRLMSQSKWTAGDVARMTLDAAAAGQVYVLPHVEGRLLWWVKRGAPQAFHQGAAKVMARARSRLAR